MMFENFHKKQKVPNNMSEKPQPILKKALDYFTNLEKTDRGFRWKLHDTVQLPISVNKKIFVEYGSIIAENVGLEEPLESTFGEVGQRFYNLKSLRSWTMRMHISKFSFEGFIWDEDKLFTYPDKGSVGVMLEPIMENKILVAELQNFRHEAMRNINNYKQSFPGVNSASFVIDKDMAEQLFSGIYYLNLYAQIGDERVALDTLELVIQ